MGQLRSKACPVCGAPNDGKWACPRCADLITVHRELLRSLQAWEFSYMAGDVSDVLSSDGQEYCLWDVKRLYEARSHLADRQALAIELCLYENVAERQAAIMMGVSERSPVAIYATVGITRLLHMAREGIIEYGLEEAP